MQFAIDKKSKQPFYDQIKSQLTAALHMGGLGSDRLPAVRAMARMAGVNPKTILKIYHRLQEEGLIEVRKGSGVRVGTLERKNFEQSYYVSLLSMMERHLEEARRMQFSPARYLQLLEETADESRRRRIHGVVVECNTEQIHLFAKEIQDHVGLTTHPVMIQDLKSRPRSVAKALAAAAFLITTDFHWDDITRFAREHGKVPVKIRLKPEFIRSIIHSARKGGLAMVVSNLDFFQNFRSALRNLGHESVIGRVHAVLFSDSRKLAAALGHVKYAYVSPLCPAGLLQQIPRRVEILQFDRHLSDESLETLRQAVLTYQLQTALESPIPSPRPPA